MQPREIDRRAITGLLLAGGQSRRMFAASIDGGDKCLLPLGDRTMLQRVIDRLAPQVDRVVLNANGDPSRFADYRLPVTADTIEGFAGPLAGVLAGMRWSAEHAPEATHVASTSTDVPFLPIDLVARMRDALTQHPTSIALARSHSGLQPVIGLWPVALADDLEAALREGVRKVLRWTDRHGTIEVAFAQQHHPAGEIDPFFNANTPEELAEAERIVQVWMP